MCFFVIIRGSLGCGKSTLSKKLSKILDAKYFAIDKVLEEYDLENDLEGGYISKASFIKVNEIIAPKANIILEKRKPVVFDGNFYWKDQIDDLISRLGFPHYVFTLKAPLNICIERDKKRSRSYGENAVRTVFKKSCELDYGIEIDITQPLEDSIIKIMSYLPKL